MKRPPPALSLSLLSPPPTLSGPFGLCVCACVLVCAQSGRSDMGPLPPSSSGGGASGGPRPSSGAGPSAGAGTDAGAAERVAWPVSPGDMDFDALSGSCVEMEVSLDGPSTVPVDVA